jgi:hypothetical protein
LKIQQKRWACGDARPHTPTFFAESLAQAEQLQIINDNLSITEQLHTLLILPQYMDGFWPTILFLWEFPW